MIQELGTTVFKELGTGGTGSHRKSRIRNWDAGTGIWNWELGTENWTPQELCIIDIPKIEVFKALRGAPGGQIGVLWGPAGPSLVLPGAQSRPGGKERGLSTPWMHQTLYFIDPIEGPGGHRTLL